MNPQFENTEDYKYLYTKLMDYLSKKDYSEKRLLQKILFLKKRFPDSPRYRLYNMENTVYIIEKLKSLKFVDELRTLRNMAEHSLQSTEGLRRIKQKMYRQAYRKENIEAVMKELAEIKPPRDMKKIIELTARKKSHLEEKYRDDEIKKRQIPQKIFAFLAQRGFEIDEIKIIINRLDRRQQEES